MYYEKLEKQKKYIIRERKSSIVIMVLFSFPLLLAIGATFLDARAVWLLAVMLVPLLFGGYSIRKENHLLRQFSSIKENKTINKTSDVRLCNPKVRLLAKTEGGQKYRSYIRQYYGIRIQDSQKKQYYYFFEEYQLFEREDIDKLLARLCREFTIQCYENTTIIRTIENDPHFLRIRLQDVPTIL